MTNNAITSRLAKALKNNGITYRGISAYGDQCVIDANKRHRGGILSVMSLAGFRLKCEHDGRHMTGPPGLRLWFVFDKERADETIARLEALKRALQGMA
jgi:hypothetical protein